MLKTAVVVGLIDRSSTIKTSSIIVNSCTMMNLVLYLNQSGPGGR